jgi:hypothetical protein
VKRVNKTSKGKDIERIFTEGTLVDEALVEGVQEALRRHKQAGLPIAEWQDGKTVWTPPEQIELRKDGSNHRAKPLTGSV